ncbi:MAG: T9SS type A sorting domain-containing protein [Ignavibacteria bacterium]|nr:T9SS type A sorting domain-containing protein [Ignavibacteria bacterium]
MRRIMFAMVAFCCYLSTYYSATANQDTIVKKICGNVKEKITFNGDGKKYRIDITSSNRSIASPNLPYNATTNTYSGEVINGEIPITRTSNSRYSGESIFKLTYTCVEPNCTDSGVVYIKVIVCNEGRDIIGLPPGESIMQNIELFINYGPFQSAEDEMKAFSITNKCVYSQEEVGIGFSADPIPVEFSRRLWCAPDGKYIESFEYKQGTRSTYLVLLNDGTVYELKFINRLQDITARELWKTSDVVENGTRFIEVAGDDIYVMTDKGILVTRDNGASWQVDTNGLNGALPTGITLDEDQNVYCATNKGLYKQALISNIWEPVTTHPTDNMVSVFIDRRQRIFTSSYGMARKSDDRGASWTDDTVGLNRKTVAKFGDDAFGNIYAITQGTTPTEIFRSKGGIAPWERIESDVINKTDPAYSTNVFFAIGGDTVITLSSTYGMLFSKDQGTTWTYNKSQAPPENIASLIKTPEGKAFLSTNTGIYFGQLGDTSWSKRNPITTFNYARPLFRDKSGILYSLGEKRSGTFGLFAFDNIISSDNGISWKSDTVGLWQISQGTYFVDENGKQYIFHIGSGANPAKIFSKINGSGWQEDMAGFTPVLGGAFEQSSCWASDSKGSVYVAETITGKGSLWKRTGSGNWVTDTVGLNNAIIYSIVADSYGNLYAGASSAGILHKPLNGAWQSIPYPKEIPMSAWTFFVTVDARGTLFATFATFDANFNFHGNGVYFTKDKGVTWRYAGLNGIASNGFVAYGDTVYAFKNSHGLYAITSREYSTAEWSPNVIDFGKVKVGTSVAKDVNISNYGNIEVVNISTSSDNPVFSVGLPPNSTINPNNYMTVSVNFQPTVKGKVTCMIILTSTGVNKYDTLFVEGEGSETSGIDILSEKDEWIILPNPSRDMVIVSTQNILLGEIKIYDANGRLVLIQKIEPAERTSIDVSCLSHGSYTITIGTKSQQLIKE